MADTDPLKIFVGGLSQATTRDSLSAYFGQFGSCDSYVMLDGSTGRSRGFGFVNFTEHEIVREVLALSHQVDGVAITVSPYSNSRSGGSVNDPLGLGLHKVAPPRDRSLKVFVGGLSQMTTKEALNEYFARFGRAESIVMMDKQTGRSRGFGFVDFTEPEAVDTVLRLQHEIDGCKVSVSSYQNSERSGVASPVAAAPPPPRSCPPSAPQLDTMSALRELLSNQLLNLQQQHQPSSSSTRSPLPPSTPTTPAAGIQLKVFVGGLSQQTTKASLNTYFAQFGQVDSYVMLDSATGRSRGFGFVNFFDEHAMNTVLRYPRHEVDGVQITCSPYQQSQAPRPSTVRLTERPAALPQNDSLQQLTTALQALQEVLQQHQRGLPLPAGDEWSVGTPTREIDCKVFVGGLAQRTTAQSLKNAFQQFSPVHCEVLPDRATGRSRGFGFVTFSSPLDVQMALLQTHVIDGKEVQLSECWDKGPREPGQPGQLGRPEARAPPPRSRRAAPY